jgi:hypothetical protein
MFFRITKIFFIEMRYADFEDIVSKERMRSYLISCPNDTRKAMTLYRYNILLSQEIIIVIGCFEIALRNAIDREMKSRLGNDWLKDSVDPYGIFNHKKTQETFKAIRKEYDRLSSKGIYSHSKLLSSLSFGIWKYMFGNPQYKATGQCLLAIFPYKPKSSSIIQYNQSFIYNQLDEINTLRNRVAHHEPNCLDKKKINIDTSHVRNKYNQISTLFQWMGIDSHKLLFGMDHVLDACDKIDKLR